jgi:hypothetical protein
VVDGLADLNKEGATAQPTMGIDTRAAMSRLSRLHAPHLVESLGGTAPGRLTANSRWSADSSNFAGSPVVVCLGP